MFCLLFCEGIQQGGRRGAGGVAFQLRARDALAEDLSLVPSTRISCLTTQPPLTPVPREPDALFWQLWVLHLHTELHICTEFKINNSSIMILLHT